MVLLFAPAIQAAAPAEHGGHAVAHDIGSQIIDGNFESKDGDFPPARVHGSTDAMASAPEVPPVFAFVENGVHWWSGVPSRRT